MPTPRQERLARILESDPPPVSHAAALRAAGYSEGSILNGGKCAKTYGVLRAREAIREEEGDTARGIRRIGQKRLVRAVQTENDAVRLSQVVLAMAKVEEAVPDAPQEGLTAAEVDAARAQVVRAFRAGFRLALYGASCRIVADLVPPDVVVRTSTDEPINTEQSATPSNDAG